MQETAPDPDLGCGQMQLPAVGGLRQTQDGLHEVMPNILLGGSYLLAFVAFLLGPSFVGAEFSSGSIGNWLTFEPRRLRVYGSKLIAAGAGMLPAGGRSAPRCWWPAPG